jgi:hypothetical protein
MLCSDAHGSQSDLRLASFFPQCVYELFLELISQKFARSGQEANWTQNFEKFSVLARLWQSYDFGFLPRCREVTESKAVIE